MFSFDDPDPIPFVANSIDPINESLVGNRGFVVNPSCKRSHSPDLCVGAASPVEQSILVTPLLVPSACCHNDGVCGSHVACSATIARLLRPL